MVRNFPYLPEHQVHIANLPNAQMSLAHLGDMQTRSTLSTLHQSGMIEMHDKKSANGLGRNFCTQDINAWKNYT
jgi:hypothetical protein